MKTNFYSSTDPDSDSVGNNNSSVLLSPGKAGWLAVFLLSLFGLLLGGAPAGYAQEVFDLDFGTYSNGSPIELPTYQSHISNGSVGAQWGTLHPDCNANFISGSPTKASVTNTTEGGIPANAGNYLLMQGYWDFSDGANENQNFLMRDINLEGVGGATLSFKSRKAGTAAQLIIQYSTNGGASYNSLVSYSNNTTGNWTTWQTRSVNIPTAALVNDVIIRFRVAKTSTTNATAYFGLDDIAITRTCPTSVTTGTIANSSSCATTLVLSGYKAGATLQWQWSATTSNFTDIPGATSDVFPITSTTPMRYRVVVTSTCPYGGSTVSTPSGYTSLRSASTGAKTWTGLWGGGTSTDFNDPMNWCPYGVPTGDDEIIMNLATTATSTDVNTFISLTNSVSLKSLTINLTHSYPTYGFDKNLIFDVGNHTLTIGTETVPGVLVGEVLVSIQPTTTVPNGGQVAVPANATEVRFRVGAQGSIVVNGDATFGTVNNTSNPYAGVGIESSVAGQDAGTVVFKGNVTFGPKAVTHADGPLTYTFSKGAAQTVLVNAPGLVLPSLQVSNGTTVSILGTENAAVDGDINVSNNSTLNLNTRTLNRQSAGGTLTVGSGSTLTLGGFSGGLGESNFPANFSTVSLNSASTVLYNGGSAANQAIAPVTYGNLTLASGSGTGRKYATGDLTVTGNFRMNIGSEFYQGSIATGTNTNYKLTVNGSWINQSGVAAAYVHRNGTVVMQQPSSGAAARQIQGNTATTFYNLEISNSSGVNLSAASMQIANRLTMTSGLLRTNANTVIITSPAAVALQETATAYVEGTVTITGRSVSPTVQAFGNLGLAITTGTGPYAATVTRVTGTEVTGVVNSQTGVTGRSIKRLFTISVTNPPADLNASLTFNFWNRDLNGMSPAELIFFRENPAAQGNWIYKGKDEGLVMPTATTAGSITKSGIPAFSTWTLGSYINPLPVELVWFTAKRKADAAVLEWKTASEENNAGYQIEVSADNRSFQDLAFVEAAATGSYGAQYSYTDEGASRYGARYYRLTQHDHDGTKTMLGVRTVAFDAGTATLAVGPNPFRQAFTATVESDRVQQATLTLTDALGREVSRQTVQLEKGTNAVPFAAQTLNNGLYLLSVQLQTEVLTTRLTHF